MTLPTGVVEAVPTPGGIVDRLPSAEETGPGISLSEDPSNVATLTKKERKVGSFERYLHSLFNILWCSYHLQKAMTTRSQPFKLCLPMKGVPCVSCYNKSRFLPNIVWSVGRPLVGGGRGAFSFVNKP